VCCQGLEEIDVELADLTIIASYHKLVVSVVMERAWSNLQYEFSLPEAFAGILDCKCSATVQSDLQVDSCDVA
jgi:hypothetical protein